MSLSAHRQSGPWTNRSDEVDASKTFSRLATWNGEDLNTQGVPISQRHQGVPTIAD